MEYDIPDTLLPNGTSSSVRRRINAPCMWCALGISCALSISFKIDSVIYTCNGGRLNRPIEIRIKDGQVDTAGSASTAAVTKDWYIHFAVPARFAWDNVVHTCSNILCFESEQEILEFRKQSGLPCCSGMDDCATKSTCNDNAEAKKGCGNVYDIRTVSQTLAMARGWYGHYLHCPSSDSDDSPTWRKLTDGEVEHLFTETGFNNQFWTM